MIGRMRASLPVAQSPADYNAARTAWADFAAAAGPTLHAFDVALKAPRDAQRECLRRILRANAATQFGLVHDFASITSIEAWQARVPVCSWAELAPQVERIKAGEAGVLTAEAPIHFERTSGSGAQHKDIPYTPALMREFQSALVVWLAALLRDCPDVAGPCYWALSPDRQLPQVTPSGATVGSASDALYLTGSPAERLLPSVVAVDVGDDSDWPTKTMSRLVIEDELRLVSVWSPTFLLSLLDADPALPERSDLSQLWPNLALISCWTDGPSAAFARQLAGLFPNTRIAPKGLFATEGVVSTSYGLSSLRPVAITSHFLEFVDSSGTARIVNELEEGDCYELLLTTSGGLYRYRLGDQVRVTGFIDATPCLEFVGRVDARSDLVGEKIDQAIVSQALLAAGVPAGAVLVPDASASPARYRLVTETADASAADAVERELGRVHHYRIARANQQLDAVHLHVVASTAALLHEAWQATGRRSGDVKAAALITSAQFAAAIVRLLDAGDRT